MFYLNHNSDRAEPGDSSHSVYPNRLPRREVPASRKNSLNELAASQLLTLIAQEIQGPLTPIVGFSEVLRDSARTHEEQELSVIISRNGRRLSVAVNTLLSVIQMMNPLDSESTPNRPVIEIVYEVINDMPIAVALSTVQSSEKTPLSELLLNCSDRIASEILRQMLHIAEQSCLPAAVHALEVHFHEGNVELIVSIENDRYGTTDPFENRVVNFHRNIIDTLISQIPASFSAKRVYPGLTMLRLRCPLCEN